MSEGLEDELEGDGWTKTRAFGHVAYVRRQSSGYDDEGRKVLWLALRIGNVPLGVPFRSQGAWALLDVVEDQPRRSASLNTSPTDQLDSMGSSSG